MAIKDFLKCQRLPRAFLRDVKFNGKILVNDEMIPIYLPIKKGDRLTLIAAEEPGHGTVIPSFEPIDIVYEDRDLLILNKPVGVVSIPSIKTPDGAMANRIKGYYIQQNYLDQVIHIVTRLDRDTSGLMIVAKHRLCHALMDRQIKEKTLQKYYYALTTHPDLPDHGMIDAPIARTDDSIITRCVHPDGKPAQTEYWKVSTFDQGSLLKLRLHTGRTHQIRVHLTYMGGPLIGDDLYGGPLYSKLERQALHCGEVRFVHPFTQEAMVFTQDLPDDMKEWMNEHTIK